MTWRRANRRRRRAAPPARAFSRPFKIAAAATAFAAMLVLATFAFGHGWYPRECCHDQDCAAIESYRVDAVSGGFLVDGLHFVPEPEARFSPDGRYHACYPNPGKPRCFFRPIPMGS